MPEQGARTVVDAREGAADAGPGVAKNPGSKRTQAMVGSKMSQRSRVGVRIPTRGELGWVAWGS